MVLSGDCEDALKANLQGFEGLKIVSTDHERTLACKGEVLAEDEPLSDVLNNIEL